jgi:predicted DNA-binding protein
MQEGQGGAFLEEAWRILEGELDKLATPLLCDQIEDWKNLKLANDIKSRLYTLVYDVCVQKGVGHSASDQLYKRVGRKVDDYCREMIAPRVRDLTSTRLLAELLTRWQKFTKLMNWFSAIFSYLDRHYTRLLQLMSLAETGVNSFRLLVVDRVTPEITRSFLSQLSLKRKGQEGDELLLKEIAQLFVDIGRTKLYFYQRDIEAPYLAELQDLLVKEKQNLATEYTDDQQFYQQAKSIVEREKTLAQQILHFSTQEKVESLCSLVLKSK